LAALALVGQDGLKPLDPVLCVSSGMLQRLETIKSQRSSQ
jgi:prenyltransferase beta subunit